MMLGLLILTLWQFFVFYVAILSFSYTIRRSEEQKTVQIVREMLPYFSNHPTHLSQ